MQYDSTLRTYFHLCAISTEAAKGTGITTSQLSLGTYYSLQLKGGSWIWLTLNCASSLITRISLPHSPRSLSRASE
ncbi:hypothetical protein POVWA2_008240 [Plasmodium ovale wallikeri]|uniref:Uncharacterized protein n=1 Tax=Plasmodium ovale wallikeri TaxID=864142 RepID=A0A1A8YJE0_PLAOA|nr:hypothetical protein POVWA1_008240 [Plasmodium ovale wallikeri]SBT32192.1 hypothetical protein POVWA2_008240 [Plasmodium ovale wallikeri]